jgi:hypothetical protein
MNHQLIIGLGNRARNGKDSFASAIDSHYASQYFAAQKHGLRNYHPVEIQRLAFADALYREVNAFLHAFKDSVVGPNWMGATITDEDNGTIAKIPDWVQPTPNVEVSTRAPYGKHAKLLQWWGTEYRRTQDSNYWVKAWKAAINPKAHIVLVTDMRFLNEAAAVKSLGGATVQVNRLNQDGTPFVDPSRDADHRSETELDGYNYDHKITVKSGQQALLEEYAITLVHYLKIMKGQK